MGLKHYKISLTSLNTGVNLTSTGGVCYVTAADSAAKVQLYTAAGATTTNPVSLTNGMMEFWTADTVATVDIYGQTPGGRGFMQKGIMASGLNELAVSTFARRGELVIPFALADTTTGTETDTGFDLPTNCLVDPFSLAVDVQTLESGKTIDVGILASESGGDADGFMDGLSLTSAVTVLPAITATTGVLGGNTYGVLVSDYTVGTNADDRGEIFFKRYRCDGTAKSISYTLASTVTVAKGFIHLGYDIANI